MEMSDFRYQLKLNWARAHGGVEYVKRKMTLGAANRMGELFRSGFRAAGCYAINRWVIDEIATPTDPEIPNWIRSKAVLAEATGCGNCEEQACLAFVYLRKQLKAAPLDLMLYLPPGDHVFVVIGRAKGTDAKDYRTWGPNAVVCDPWDNNYYEAKNSSKERTDGGKHRTDSVHRID
jgi:hypothetical protein